MVQIAGPVTSVPNVAVCFQRLINETGKVVYKMKFAILLLPTGN